MAWPCRSPTTPMDVAAERRDTTLGRKYLPLDGLHRLSAAVNRAEQAEQIYDAAIAALLESLNADRAAILLYDSEQVMRFVASHGLSPAYRQVVEGHSPWTADTVDPQPVLIDDVDLVPALAELLPTIKREGIGALGFVPLLYRGRLLGKFMVYFDHPHIFTEEERMLSQTIANHIAFAIEQKRSENNLRLYRKIFEHSPTSIGVIDLSGHYIDQNAAHRELIGYSAEELQAETPAVHLGEEGFRVVLEGLQQADLFRQEMVSTSKAGKLNDIDLSAFTVRDEDGQPICFVGMKHDITIRKEAERQIRQMNMDLEDRVETRTADLVRAKEEMEGFCYSVSHDLRAPLRGINASAMMLLEDYPDKLDDQGKRHLKRLVDASNRMAKLIDDLLQYSRLGRKEPSRATLDLAATARKVAEDLQRKNSEWEHVAIDVQPVTAIEADPQLMEMVVYNLLENACKFTKGKENPCVEFGGFREEDWDVFFVRDNGAGFDPQYAGRLFRPFERLHSESEFPGTGIGLANAKRIMERHGGSIWAEGKPGEGATFYFALPIK